jgi:hypothetical protein
MNDGLRVSRLYWRSRTGDPSVGDFDDAKILKVFGEVDEGLLAR